jgi:hypothetical protein
LLLSLLFTSLILISLFHHQAPPAMDPDTIVAKIKPFFLQEDLKLENWTQFYNRCYEEYCCKFGFLPNASTGYP